MNTPHQAINTVSVNSELANFIDAYKLYWKISSGMVHVSPHYNPRCTASEAQGSTRIELKDDCFVAQHWTDHAEPLCHRSMFMTASGLYEYIKRHPWY